MRTRWAVSLIVIAFGLLLAAWVFSTPPLNAPDEQAHYYHAIGLSEGTLLGPKETAQASSPLVRAQLAHSSRGIELPGTLAPPKATCVNGHPVPLKGSCLVLDYNASYTPIPYVAPAIAVSFSSHFETAFWLARVGSALVWLGFLALAAALLWAGTAWSVLGLIVAITPMSLFVGSIVNEAGFPFAAQLAFAAGVWRITRSPRDSPVWVWLATAGSGAALAVSYQIGWLAMLATCLTAIALVRRSAFLALVSERRRELGLTVAVLLAATAVFFAYAIDAQLLYSTFSLHPFGTALREGVDTLRITMYGIVAMFQLLNVTLPGDGYYWTWWGLILALIVGALLLGDWRERGFMALVTVVALAFVVLFYAWVYRNTGFGLQARQVMPVLVLVPLLAGELVFRHRDRIPTVLWGLPFGVITVCACFQVFAWGVNARTSAGEPNAFWFFRHPYWSPPGGWVPWGIAAALGAVTLVVFCVVDAFSTRATGDANAPSLRHIASHTRSI